MNQAMKFRNEGLNGRSRPRCRLFPRIVKRSHVSASFEYELLPTIPEEPLFHNLIRLGRRTSQFGVRSRDAAGLRRCGEDASHTRRRTFFRCLRS